MFKNYLKIALRQLRKQKFYSAIKIGGFALGIATCLLITLYIRNELSYDRDYPDGDRIYRATGVWIDEVVLIALATVSMQALRAATANPAEALRIGD